MGLALVSMTYDSPAARARPSARSTDNLSRQMRITDDGHEAPLDDRLSAAMAAAQAGDAVAYRQLLAQCLPIIAAMARAQRVRPEAIDDVVQDTLLTIHRARATYDPARPFLPWLRAITQRRAIDVLRRAGRRPQEVHDPIAFEAEADRGPAPGQHLEDRERNRDLAQAVAALPAGQREAVEHLAFQERSLAEASILTGRSTGALKVNLHRALKALRATLARGKDHHDV